MSRVPADKFFVTAILVTHDGAAWLPEVIAALGSQSRPLDRIVAVDTASVDNSAKLLKSAGILTFAEDREMGYGDAIEHALALTPVSGENEWIWLIHDDCAPDRNALALMLSALEERPHVAIAGPKLRSWYDRNQLLEVGVSIAGNGSRWTGLEDDEQDQGQHDVISDVMSVSTAAMLVSRNVFEELGGLDINLALFRDDVDFGWRAHVAGYKAICVPEALAYHAEASARERRAVDVSEAFLQRPLLLDRRNAAYVLIVNSSWWLLPWVVLQLFTTSVVRAIINLLLKLPGYAGDEIGAVALLLIHPAELFQARRARRKKRLLSARVVSQYIPSTWSQFQLAVDRARAVIVRRIIPERASNKILAVSYSDIGEIAPDFDDAVMTPSAEPTLWKSLFKKPQFLIAFVVAVISLFASRSRFGSLSGGALALSPHSGLDLLHRYSESWHLVGLGSSVAMPPWVALLALTSILTLGNLALLLTLIFLFAPAISYLAIYRVLLRQGVQRNYSLVGAGIYAASPLLWTSINQGRLGTLLVLQLAPTLLALSPFAKSAERSSWRRIFAVSLLAGVLAAFSPLLLAIWVVGQFMLVVIALVEQRGELKSLGAMAFIFSEHLDGVKRRFALFLTPWLLTFPWSASLILHPTQIFLEPGIPLASGNQISIALFNPGGLSSPPVWLLAPFLLFFVICLLVNRLRNFALAASVALGGALMIGKVSLRGHGSSAQVWSGPLIAIAMLLLLAPVLIYAQESLPTLPHRRVGLRHAGWAGMALLVVFNLIGMTVWAVSGGAQSLVTAHKPSYIPAFINSLQQTPARPKTIVLASTGKGIIYFVTRGADIYLGDADISIAPPDPITQAMNTLVSGSGLTSARTLGLYGIQYLYLQNPMPKALVRSIDGAGGFSRMSATADGIVWRIIGSSPRLLFFSSTEPQITIKSRDVSAIANVPHAGRLQLAEKYDQSWRLLLDGHPIPLERSSSGLPVFTVPQAGEISLSYDGTMRRALLSIELITMIFAIVMALPAGRRRRDIVSEATR